MSEQVTTRWWWPAGWGLILVLVIAGCEDRCADEIPAPPGGLEGAYALAEAVPDEARAVAYSEHLGELVEGLDAVTETIPADVAGPGDVAAWNKAGAWLEGPAVAFWTGDQWAVVGWVEHERDVELDRWPGEGQRKAVELEGHRSEAWRERDGQGQWQRWASTDGRRIARGWSTGAGGEALDEAIWDLGEGAREVDGHQAELDRHGADGAVARGVVDVGLFMERLAAPGRAEFLRDHLAEQMGQLYWRVLPGEEGESWKVELYMPGMADAPVAIGDLGEARGKLPDVGGLARPGAPAVLRLSVDPERFAQLVRRTLEVDERQRLDETLSKLEHELNVDVEGDVIDNITGQLAVVVFGLEDRFFEVQGLELFAALTRLEGTREAVVVPIEDRDRMEAVLDALTALSRGGLRRQAMEHTIQYAWFDDGALEWAVISSDDHLVFVDSMVAFDHVASWERSPSRFDDALVERGVEAMMEARRGLAMYLDLATVRGVLLEGGSEVMTTWLKPLEAVRVETDVDGRKERADIVLWSSQQGRAEEE